MRLLLLPALLLAGCTSQLAPFEVAPRSPAGAAPASDQVGICYNSTFTEPASVREAAGRACGPTQTPRLLMQDVRFACPLLLPVRATFVCERVEE